MDNIPLTFGSIQGLTKLILCGFTVLQTMSLCITWYVGNQMKIHSQLFVTKKTCKEAREKYWARRDADYKELSAKVDRVADKCGDTAIHMANISGLLSREIGLRKTEKNKGIIND